MSLDMFWGGAPQPINTRKSLIFFANSCSLESQPGGIGIMVFSSDSTDCIHST